MAPRLFLLAECPGARNKHVTLEILSANIMDFYVVRLSKQLNCDKAMQKKDVAFSLLEAVPRILRSLVLIKEQSLTRTCVQALLTNTMGLRKNRNN